MSDEPKHGRVSMGPVKRGRRRLQGRHKLKSAASGANGSDDQHDASSNEKGLSKPVSESLPAGLQKKSKEAIASDDTFVVEVDASTSTIRLNGNLRIFGTNNEDSALALAKQVIGLVPTTAGKLNSQNLKWAMTTVYGIGPKDELEGLLAVQMIGVHNLAIECLRRASLEGQTFEGIDADINRAVRLLRTFTSQMEALNRHRGKVGQSMVVGNVNVNDGGQAIVGPVSRSGLGKVAPADDGKKVE